MRSEEQIRLVDDVALAICGDVSPEVVAFWRSWEAWGIWANGGFEAVVTGGLADDLPAVVDAFEEVSVPAMAELFRRAAAVLPADIVTSFAARTAFFESGDEAAACAALQAWKELDQEMEALPDIKGRLWEVLQDRDDLRDRADR